MIRIFEKELEQVISKLNSKDIHVEIMELFISILIYIKLRLITKERMEK